jgi:predicted secreted Zn-dependent protease
MLNPLIALFGAYASTAVQGYGQAPSPPPAVPVPVTKKQAPAPVVVALPAVPGRGIRDVPNIAIKYYDVSGKDFAGIIGAMVAQRPKDPATGQLMTGNVGWGLTANITRRTEGTKCTVTGAKARFTPTAELPRLVNEQALKPDQLALWRAYLSQLEVPAAAGLWFVQDRIAAFEKSLIGLECAAATKLGAEGIEKIRADYAAFQRQNAAANAGAAPPAPTQ